MTTADIVVAADHGRIAKLDRDDAPKPPDKIDPAVGKALAQARSDKKNADGKSMTQKELATAVNARPNDVSPLHFVLLPYRSYSAVLDKR